MSTWFLENQLKGYEKFLFLAVKNLQNTQNFSIHPSKSIDVIWRTHLLNPVVYHDDMMKVLNHFVDYLPWNERDKRTKTKDGKLSYLLWNKEYSDEMLETLVFKFYFPREIMINIFKFLSVNDLINVGFVCHEWRISANDNSNWEYHFINHYKKKLTKNYSYKNQFILRLLYKKLAKVYSYQTCVDLINN